MRSHMSGETGMSISRSSTMLFATKVPISWKRLHVFLVFSRLDGVTISALGNK